MKKFIAVILSVLVMVSCVAPVFSVGALDIDITDNVGKSKDEVALNAAREAYVTSKGEAAKGDSVYNAFKVTKSEKISANGEVKEHWKVTVRSGYEWEYVCEVYPYVWEIDIGPNIAINTDLYYVKPGTGELREYTKIEGILRFIFDLVMTYFKQALSLVLNTTDVVFEG